MSANRGSRSPSHSPTREPSFVPLLAPRKRRASAFALVRTPGTCSAQPTESLCPDKKAEEVAHAAASHR